MEDLLGIAGQYGVLGLVSLASFWYINKQNGQNQKNDEDHIKNLLDINRQVMQVVEKNTEVMTELKEAIRKN